MNPEQIELIQASFKQVEPITEQATELFYQRLFEIDPSLRPLFKGDMVEQGNKFMAAIATVIDSLHEPENIIPIAEKLGARHVGFGVEDMHYTTFAHALIWTLEQSLGSGFTDDVRDAWIEVYTLLSEVMIDGANKYRDAQAESAAPASPPVATPGPTPEPAYEPVDAKTAEDNASPTEREEAIAALVAEVDKVGAVASEISAIAKQTNLLALNATIEAARAGEAGKGFAVVAGEVKNLSGKTASATQEISAVVDNLRSEIARLRDAG